MIRKLLYKNFLLIYSISRWLRNRFTSDGMMVLAILTGAAIFGIDSRQTHAYQIFSILLCILFFTLLSTLFIRGKFQFRRELPEYATAGLKLSYRVNIQELSNRDHSGLIIHDMLREKLPGFAQYRNAHDLDDKFRNYFDRLIGYPRLINQIRKLRGADTRESSIDSIGALQSIDLMLELYPLRRGYIYFDKCNIAKTDPLGIFKKKFYSGERDRLLVLPKCYDMPDIQMGGSRQYHPGGLNQSISVGDSEEFFSLRDYRPGDPVRSIHWRSYARRGEPVIKEYQDEYYSRMALVLDTFPGDQPDYVFEEAVSVASSVVLAHRQQDTLLDLLLINNKAYRMTTGRGLSEAENMLEVLACVESSITNNFASLSELVNSHRHQTSGFILVMMSWDMSRKELVRQLRQENIPVLVIIIQRGPASELAADDPMADKSSLVWQLEAGNIQASLNQQSLNYETSR